MANEHSLEAVEAQLAEQHQTVRDFIVPVARAIAALSGRARPRDVKKKVRELLSGVLNEKQLDFLEVKNRYGWVRLRLRDAGLVAGEYGYWELTDLGRAYLEAHAGDRLEILTDVPESAEPSSPADETEPVEVTSYHAYEIPLLAIMDTSATDKTEILDALGEKLAGDLLPGDYRLMPRGVPVWRFRGSWALSTLGNGGYVDNVGTGKWQITSAGRERLAAEAATWKVSDYRGARARVRIEGQRPQVARAETRSWNEAAWTSLRGEIARPILDALRARIRPDLGASPDRPIARNVILYGPPGTGKTHIAKRVAGALVGDSGPEHLRIVQLHPSYAYEDFVQGLRPDIKQTQIRYELSRGPFLRIAEAAREEPDAFFVLIIDEINRGDPARIFGELLYALEYRDEPIDLALGGELVVPSNLVIVGTMNSVDRSVALVDYALRRRFGFVRVDPSPSVIQAVRGEGLLAEAGPGVLEHFNTWLTEHLDREHVLGHSFFISPSIPDDAEDAFERLWTSDIGPLLEEYFFHDSAGFASARTEWHRIVDAERAAQADLRKDLEADELAES